jgi:hypothetical protein
MFSIKFIKYYFLLLAFCFIEFFSFAQGVLTKSQLDTCRIYAGLDDALKIPEKVFVLDLSGSNINKIPGDIIKLINLQRLNLANNNISELPQGLFQLKYLQELNLEENKLNVLPATIGNLIHLKKLNLTRTKINSLPSEISNLNELENLDISWNDLHPDSIIAVFKLTKLKSLNLQRNLLDTLSPEIANLINLHKLNLNFNPLTTLPEQIGNLSNLVELDLGKNTELISLPTNFKKLIKLEYLNLSEVPLSAEEMQKLPAIDKENIEF